MSKISGKELYELLQNGVAVLSADSNELIHSKTKEVLAKKIASKNGRHFFQALGDESTEKGSVKLCVEWGWDETNKISICLEWAYE